MDAEAQSHEITRIQADCPRCKALEAREKMVKDTCEAQVKWHRESAPYANGGCLCHACQLADRILAAIAEREDGGGK